MRLFIAIEVPPTIQKRLSRVGREIAGKVSSVRPVRPENIHLTLHFLGDIDEEKIEDLSEAVSAVAVSNPGFTIQVRSIGSFGSRRSPSVLWAGVDESEELLKLHSDLGERLVRMSIHVEERGFRPHLTFARVRPGRGAERLSSLLEKHSDMDIGVIAVNGISLIRSTLTSGGAKYEVLLSAALSQ